MSRAAGRREITVDRALQGGATLEWHYENGAALEKIRTGKYDIIVLQDQSMRPAVDPEMTLKFARLFDEEIKKSGAKTVLFLTWARQHLPEMQEKLDATYYAAAKELEAKIAPVGPAWKTVFSEIDGLVLHSPDKSHPNPTGSYLTACVFYATLTDASPVGLPVTLKDGDKTLASLDKDLAAKLQKIAEQTVRGGNSP